MRTDPLCSPSRAAILTGTFPHNHGLTDNNRLNTSTFHPVAEARTVNVWLQQAGYDTMLAGKYMNGYHANGPNRWARYVPPGWSSFYGFQTVDFFGTAVNVNGVTKVYPKDNYQTDIIANISLDWMRQTHDKTKPFFMFITPHAPHAPYTPAPRHKGTLAGLTQPQDPAFNLPDALQRILPGNLAHLPLVNASQMDSIYESRAEALLAIDEMIGHLLDEVTALGVQSNTYFFFTCDSKQQQPVLTPLALADREPSKLCIRCADGYHLGQHRMPPGKREIYQTDINVPLIVSGPGIAPHSTVDGMSANYDFAPTWAELAGAKPSPTAPPIDGKSLVPLMRGETKTIRTYTLQEGYQSCEAGHGEGRSCAVKAPPPSLAVAKYVDDETEVTGPEVGANNFRDYSGLRMKHHPFQGKIVDVMYVEYTGAGNGPSSPEPGAKGASYYDCALDPWQTKDLYSSLSPAEKAALSSMLAAVKDCKGSECP